MNTKNKLGAIAIASMLTSVATKTYLVGVTNSATVCLANGKLYIATAKGNTDQVEIETVSAEEIEGYAFLDVTVEIKASELLGNCTGLLGNCARLVGVKAIEAANGQEAKSVSDQQEAIMALLAERNLTVELVETGRERGFSFKIDDKPFQTLWIGKTEVETSYTVTLSAETGEMKSSNGTPAFRQKDEKSKLETIVALAQKRIHALKMTATPAAAKTGSKKQPARREGRK